MFSDNANRFLGWINGNYDKQKRKMETFCLSSAITFNADVFGDTIVKMYDKILKNNIEDPTEKGFENYFFKAFKTNIIREKQYARNSRCDDNYDGEVDEVYEDWYNKENDGEVEKLKRDLWLDYSTLYIMAKVEENFDDEHLYLFKMKYLMPKMTYPKLQKTTKLKNVRQKVIDVKNWLKENVTKDEIKKAFYSKYGNLLD